MSSLKTTPGSRAHRGALHLSLAALLISFVARPALAKNYDLVILNGRVMHPEKKLDRVANVGVEGGEIARIHPSGAMISQASGHLDFRPLNQATPAFGGAVPTFQRYAYGVVVDGVLAMLTAAREQLRLGASQIKLAIGCGVASPTDSIDVTKFTKEEIVAAVAAAHALE